MVYLVLSGSLKPNSLMVKGSHSNGLTGFALAPGTVTPGDFSLSTIEVHGVENNTYSSIMLLLSSQWVPLLRKKRVRKIATFPCIYSTHGLF